jgi:hypothetical protein
MRSAIYKRAAALQKLFDDKKFRPPMTSHTCGSVTALSRTTVTIFKTMLINTAKITMLNPRTLIPMPNYSPLALPTGLILPMGPTSLVLLNSLIVVNIFLLQNKRKELLINSLIFPLLWLDGFKPPGNATSLRSPR